MAYGDKVYARLVLNGIKVVEFVLERVTDMTELIGELRYRTQQYSGLARLYVRNLTRGWSEERPFMLYRALYPDGGSPEADAALFSTDPQPARRRQICPWETH